MIGKTVSHYKILEHLGGGGMGVVYKAQDIKLDRFVALKFLPPDLTRDPEAKQRFVHEAKAASALQHNNICVVYDIDETPDGQMFISMGYLEGETLKKKIERGPLKIEEAIDLMIQVAQGLMKAHEHGIVHRDIKPANIMITNDGVARIVDFGLAKLSGRTMLTKAGSTLGTAAYMSPEQAKGESADHRTDIWSLGVMLYEMASGKKPFDAEYENALLYSVLNSEPEPLTAVRTGIPIQMEHVVGKCLAKRPADRYQHVDEFVVDLRHLSREPSPRDTLTIQERTGRARKRHTIVYGMGVLTLVGIVTVAWWLLRGGGDRRTSEAELKSIAVLPLATLGAGQEERMLADGIHGEILNRLTKIKALKVKAETSVLQYRETRKRIREIGEELGVDFLMEGSVHRAGGQVRVQAQLIDAKTEDRVWADTYDRPFADLLDIESSIAQRIAGKLNALLTPREQDLLDRKPTKNLEAYEYYLKGMYYWNIPAGSSGNEKASEMFQKAVNLDSSFALAQAYLAIVELTQATFALEHRAERLEMAKRALDQAQSFAPDLPEVHSAMANYKWYVERDSAGTVSEFETALSDQPNSVEALWSIGSFLLNQGAVEPALEYITRAYELDRIDNDAYLAAACNMYLRRFEEAERWYNILVSNDPASWRGYHGKVTVALYGFGDIEKAKRVLDEALAATTEKSNWRERAARFHIAYCSRDYREALLILITAPAKERYYGSPLALPLSYANLQQFQLCKLLGETVKGKAYLDSAITESRHYSWHEMGWSALGLVYAMQGRREEALREMARALHPGAKTLNWARASEHKVAQIWIALGEYERAIDELERLLSVPGEVTKARLRLDPIYDPLRSNPRFQALVAKNK